MERPFLIGIAGGSGSGKTTFACRLVDACARSGIVGQIFSLDNYYQSLDHMTLAARRAYNFDHPDAIDFALAAEHLKALLAGRPVRQPVYDFKLHTRKEATSLRRPSPLMVVEGLYALYPSEILALYDYTVFVSTGLATGLLRRVQRDVEERGRTLEGAKRQIITTVLPMYENFVKPTQRNAHFSINWEGDEIPEKATEGLVRMIRDHFHQPVPKGR